MITDETRVLGLELFKLLIKSGCEWHGDVLSRKWSECLLLPQDEVITKNILDRLVDWPSEVYLIKDGAIWIA